MCHSNKIPGNWADIKVSVVEDSLEFANISLSAAIKASSPSFGMRT